MGQIFTYSIITLLFFAITGQKFWGCNWKPRPGILKSPAHLHTFSMNHGQFGPLPNRPPEKSILVKSANLEITPLSNQPLKY